MDPTLRAKHLEMLQAVIGRLSNTSFLIKGWGLTVLAGVLAVAAAKDSFRGVVWAALVPLFAFAALDAYYLWLERLFRAHYARVRVSADRYDFDMNIHDLKRDPVESYVTVFRRPSIYGFWLPILVAVPVAYIVLRLAYG